MHCVWVTLNGAVTLTLGAVVSVEPLTDTLPVVPGSVHSGVPAFCAMAVGQVSAAGGVSAEDDAVISVAEEPVASTADDVLADRVSFPEPHAVTTASKEATEATTATEEDRRGEFTVRHATALPR